MIEIKTLQKKASSLPTESRNVPEQRVRVFGIIDPDEFKREVVDKRFSKLPFFIRYEMKDDGYEYIGYLYFQPHHDEQIDKALRGEHLPYRFE